jgi:hypothetical protein
LTGIDANLDGSASYDRPNYNQALGWSLPNPTTAMWFNTAAFTPAAVPGISVDGNSPRNVMFGPSSLNMDMAISRTFSFTERFKLQFRGEATNAFNIVNLNNPSLSMAAPASFGKISAAAPMRQVQLGLRLMF